MQLWLSAIVTAALIIVIIITTTNTDAGLRMGTGLAVGDFYLEFAYDLGLVNLPNSGYDLMGFDDFSDTMKSNTLSFSIGYNF